MTNQSQFKVELEQEEDGRWIGEVPSLPGVLVMALLVLRHKLPSKRLPFGSWLTD